MRQTKECGGTEVSKGNVDSIDKCAIVCNGVASMFAFGTNDFGVTRCHADGCTCLCETGAKVDGTCNMVSHKGYHLYRYGNANIEWNLVVKTKECGGSEVNKGRMDSIDECAKACNGISSMFAFGTNDFGVVRCFSDGCQCLCETAAKDDGTCDMVDHKGYHLYRLGPLGKY